MKVLGVPSRAVVSQDSQADDGLIRSFLSQFSGDCDWCPKREDLPRLSTVMMGEGKCLSFQASVDRLGRTDSVGG